VLQPNWAADACALDPPVPLADTIANVATTAIVKARILCQGPFIVVPF
jgi:hypothetical protein